MKHYQQLQQYLERSAELFPDKVALISQGISYTYSYLEKKSSLLSRFFIASGLLREDRVIIHSGNTIETVISFWATLKASGVVSIINPDLPKEKIKYIINDLEAVFFVSSLDSPTLLEFSNEYKNIIAISTRKNNESIPEETKITWFYDIFNMEYDGYILYQKNLDIDLAAIVYTTGSTGEPKGVMLSHKNILSASDSINTYLEHASDDVFISALPLSFDYGLYQMILCFSVSATLILESNFLLPSSVLKKIEKFKATVLPGVPTIFTLLHEYKKIKSYDLSSVRTVTNTGASLTKKHIQILKETFPKSKIYSMYGVTECKRCTYLAPDKLDTLYPSVGKAIPNTELWIANENGEKLPPYTVGELVIRGSTVMQGYWKKPEETKKKLREGLLPYEKVLYTGDSGWIDEEGNFYFMGRMDEMIKVRGQKVSPKEIEDFLMKKQSIKEVAIIGIPDIVCDEMIIAFVAPELDTLLDETTIREYCRKELEPYKQPLHVEILSALPKNTNGKIDKITLKDLFLKNQNFT